MRAPYGNFFRNLKRASTYYRPPRMETDARLGQDPLHIRVPRTGSIGPSAPRGDAFDRVGRLAWPGAIALLAGLFIQLTKPRWVADFEHYTAWLVQTSLAVFAFIYVIAVLRARETRPIRYTAAAINLLFPAVLAALWLGLL